MFIAMIAINQSFGLLINSLNAFAIEKAVVMDKKQPFLIHIVPVSDDIINDYANIEELYLPIDPVRGKNNVTESNELSDFSHESQIVSSCFDGVLMGIESEATRDANTEHSTNNTTNKSSITSENSNTSSNNNNGNIRISDNLTLNLTNFWQGGGMTSGSETSDNEMNFTKTTKKYQHWSRPIHLPKRQTSDDEKDHGGIVPSAIKDIRENIATVMSSIKALDLGLPTYSVDDYFDPSLTSTMIVTMIITLFRAMMDSQVNVKMHPELIRLAQTDEEKENAPQISSSEWLRRWLIYMKNPVVKRHGRNKSGASSGSLALTISLQELAKGDPEKEMNSYGNSLTPTPESAPNNDYSNPNDSSGMGGLARRKLTLSSVSNTSTKSDAVPPKP